MAATGPTDANLDSKQAGQATIAQELGKISGLLVEEAQLLGEVVLSIESRLDSLLGGEPQTPSHGDVEGEPENLFAAIRQTYRRMQSARSRLETCCNRL